MRSWLTQHGRGLRAATTRFGAAPLGALFNVLVISFALALPLGFYTVLNSLQLFAGRALADNAPQLQAYLTLDAKPEDVAQIERQLRQHDNVGNVQFMPREQALRELKQSSGLADVIDSLPQNPLPDAFIISLREPSPAALEALRDTIQTWPHIAHVQSDSAWAQRLDALLKIGRFAAVLLATLFAIVLAAVTFNTIRLQILTQRDEIEVAKLIGATDAFIRRPLLYFGVLLGLASAGVAWLLVSGSVAFFNHEFATLAQLTGSLPRLNYPDSGATLILLALAAGLGWLGAWLAATRTVALLEAESK